MVKVNEKIMLAVSTTLTILLTTAGLMTITTVTSASAQCVVNDPILCQTFESTDRILGQMGEQMKEMQDTQQRNIDAQQQRIDEFGNVWMNACTSHGSSENKCNMDFKDCDQIGLTSDECGAFLGLAPNSPEMDQSIQMKLDQAIAAQKASNTRLDTMIETQKRLYGPGSGWAESFCMPYCE